jgi:hypothetical protein
MLITRPNHDITTNYLFYWSIVLITTAERKKIPVTDLQKKRANIKEFTSVIKKTKPELVVLNGHGDSSTITGYDNEPLVKAGRNHDLLKGTTVYARSCQSAKQLGSTAVNTGCKAFIGYDDDFVFVTEDDKVTQPLKDKTAELFLNPSNQVVISLLKGHTAAEANQRSKKIFKRTIQKLMSSAATGKDTELIPNLVWDYLHQVC